MREVTSSQKPLQRQSWAEKTKNDYQWFKDNIDYRIGGSTFNGFRSETMDKTSMKLMYDVYNNQIPNDWFAHITDPLSAKDSKHKKFPAKIRPTNILRTDIDLLLSEWLKRRFPWQVQNLGEDGYNKFLEALDKALQQNLTEIFMAQVQQDMQAQGQQADVSQMTPDQLPLPEDTKKKFMASYKDVQAIKGQRWLKRALVEYRIVHTLHTAFKDYLLAGEGLTYKGIRHGELAYERWSPLFTDYDKSPDTEFIEDGEWASHLYLMTASDVVDLAYDELKEKDHAAIEDFSKVSTPGIFYDYLNGLSTKQIGNYIPVYYVTWKGKKKIYIVHYKDPETGEPQEDRIDEAEADVLKKFGEDAELEPMWVNESYEGYRAGDDVYFGLKPVIAQRNALNNFSTTKLSVNGRRYSDTHSQNISIAQIGIPYLIMYMIVGRTLELTIAKSKGKIFIFDKNTIPRKDGWTEERFFYYSEALGYAALDRNQVGVDKSFNQFQVIDMGLFENIEQLINLQQHYKQEWDDVIGITRQRKGQTLASETNSSNDEAIFRSTVLTEMIFNGFDEFRLREYQGLLDLSKFTNASGYRRLFNGDEEGAVLLEINPEAYSMAPLGILITQDPQDEKILEMMKGQAPNFIQNNIKPSTILTMLQAGNIAELKADLMLIESMEQEMAASAQDKEAQDAQDADERTLKYMEYEKILEEQLINVEYDRKEDVEELKGELQIISFANQKNAGGDYIAEANEAIKQQNDREKIASQERIKERETAMKERTSKLKEFLSLRKTQLQEANKVKIATEKNKVDIKKARITKKAQPKKTTK